MPTPGFGSQLNSSAPQNGNGFSSVVGGLNPLNPARYFLNGHDEEDKFGDIKDEDRIPTPDVKSYLRLTDPDDKFPTLIRQDNNSGLVCYYPYSSNLNAFFLLEFLLTGSILFL